MLKHGPFGLQNSFESLRWCHVPWGSHMKVCLCYSSDLLLFPELVFPSFNSDSLKEPVLIYNSSKWHNTPFTSMIASDHTCLGCFMRLLWKDFHFYWRLKQFRYKGPGFPAYGEAPVVAAALCAKPLTKSITDSSASTSFIVSARSSLARPCMTAGLCTDIFAQKCLK